MTLQIVPVHGRDTWWLWRIRDAADVLVEQSTIQFRSAETAEARGRTRLAALERLHADQRRRTRSD